MSEKEFYTLCQLEKLYTKLINRDIDISISSPIGTKRYCITRSDKIEKVLLDYCNTYHGSFSFIYNYKSLEGCETPYDLNMPKDAVITATSWKPPVD